MAYPPAWWHITHQDAWWHINCHDGQEIMHHAGQAISCWARYHATRYHAGSEYPAGQHIMVGKTSSWWARYHSKQDTMVGKISHSARYHPGQDMLGKIISCSARYHARTGIILGKISCISPRISHETRYCAWQDNVLGKISS